MPKKRTDSDYAIEFAEYLAKSAENLLNAISRTEDDLRDEIHAVRCDIGQFRKRAMKAESGNSVAAERLRAILDWADLALANPEEFNKHGVRNLEGPVFDEARLALAE